MPPFHSQIGARYGARDEAINRTRGRSDIDNADGHIATRDTYERARQAVEDARRELEERRRAQQQGLHQAPAAGKSPYSFLTQAQRPAATTRTPPSQRVGSDAQHSPRVGYALQRESGGWPAPRSTYQKTTGIRDNSVPQQPGLPHYGGQYDNYAPTEDTVQSPRPIIGSAQDTPQKSFGGRRKTLVIDLDETLVHSCFEPCMSDLRVPMTMDGQRYIAYVKKRPGCNEFLRKATELFEVIIWTASLSCYASPVIDELERGSGCGRLRRMYRESCSRLASGYVKDLRVTGRDLSDVALLDNTPGTASLQPNNLIDISSWYDDPHDRELYNLTPLLNRMAAGGPVPDAIRRRS
eukprot:TRINITY_DN14410_c0_g2_i1.p1 TRINITY_DN14410_c0_g2~~TRINITY_DN14410_c0_g2_i1.p1  ORF type:complete len:393 (+),score=107.60 TRINITY_DN14410_c0_g2_i1:124-1179(+)